MAEIAQSTEGYATMQYKLVLGQRQTLTFDAQRVTFVDAELKDDVYGTGTGLHTFRTLDPNFLDAIKQVMSTGDPVLELRLGFGTPQSMFWLPWQRHVIIKYFARYEGIATAAGHLLVFQTANELVRINRSHNVTARKGTIAEIVAGIADENDLKSVVEPTDGKFMLYQCFQDSTHFINERLLGRAVNGNGRSGYFFFIRDNVLHFHTPDYQSSARQMNYYDVFGTELTITDMSQDPSLWNAGIAGSIMVTIDPYTGQTREIRSDPDKALRLADSIYNYGNVDGGEQVIPYHLSFNPPVETNAMAQFNYQRARQQTFKGGVSVNKTINIRHGDLLNLSITQQNSKASSHSGYFYVTSAAHIVKKQAVTSLYTLERGEVRGQDQSLSSQNAEKQLVPESKAPGQDPNILEIQSSEVTKGAGNQTRYSTVLDANIA